MRTRIQKWGNSLALRIPRTVAAEARLGQDSMVELTLEGGRVILTPLPQPSPTLDDLLAGVTDENLHGEVLTGPPCGAELW